MADDVVDFSYKPPTQRRRKNPKQNSTGLIVTLIVVVVIGAVVAAIVVSNNNSSKSEAAIDSKHKITGGVYVANKQGGTEIMRGIDVYLFPPQVDAETAKNILIDQKNNWITAINNDHVKVNHDKATVAAQNEHKNMFNDYQAVQAIDEKRLADDEAGLEKIDEAIRAITGPMPVRQMYQKASVLAMDLTPQFRCGSIGVSKTSMDGKFTLEGVPDGTYCLCAGVSNDVLHAEWCVPVTLSGSDREMDLGDSNAEPTAHKFK
jgi:hypothetical protein